MEASKVPSHSLEISESSFPLISFDEERASETTLPFLHPKPGHRLLAAIPRLVVVAFAIWGFLSLLVTLTQNITPGKVALDIYRPTTLPTNYNLCDCGTTIAEARSRGCKYDSMGASWLPKYCRDEELTAEFEQSGTEPDNTWPYYADANGTHRISIDEIAASGKGSFYATRYWHVAHCLFYWEKYVRMRQTGAVMEARFDSEKHTQHCRKLALKKNANPDLLIEVEVVMNSAVEIVDHEHENH
ncbi:hypothetical protein P153DRAFT_386821 [Dothidotthia symphoricarpi CBS 119687]|uniref:Uncharacterized protein n=1 Tax=Dothidotthia symphoricarpi CBS 119687 TaxID=1392245 RepID=A0A6A6ACS1_9PLEO|nr:uncharacterized protein P153DRAFT_386821 [Dothidotthia symphoricarpi CBS 119687]KAF2128708.1 hypothetical protein P153DRAFT_386821 [Dothidotthia symphoricarpi CBS 119687]